MSAFLPKADHEAKGLFLSSLSSGAYLLLSVAPSCSRTDVLRHTATLGVNNPLRLTPTGWHSKLSPDVAPSTLQEVNAIRVAGERQPQCAIEVISFSMAVDQTL